MRKEMSNKRSDLWRSWRLALPRLVEAESARRRDKAT